MKEQLAAAAVLVAGAVSSPVAADATTDAVLDSLICPVLSMTFPPNGDIGGVWDCPPYT